jgi:hypothetical protein
VDFGLFCRIYAVKGKEISIFLQIWTGKYVYLWNLTRTWSDTIRPCQMIGLETRLGWRTDRKFLQNPNLNENRLSEGCVPEFYIRWKLVRWAGSLLVDLYPLFWKLELLWPVSSHGIYPWSNDAWNMKLTSGEISMLTSSRNLAGSSSGPVTLSALAVIHD